MARAPRRRLPAEEARKRILDAAEKRLVDAGPEGLRLVELAHELGISHPAILHHFGTREELVRAVVERAMTALNTELITAFETTLNAPEHMQIETLLERIAETLADRGQARLMAWLILSGLGPPELRANVRLLQVAQGAHALRVARTGNKDLPLEDTMFFVQLTASALLADAVFGDALRKLEFASPQRMTARDFRSRLAKLLREQLDGTPRKSPGKAVKSPRKAVKSQGKGRTDSRSRRQ